jgi:HAD superfamily hydrolase (TIGR01509 family)
VSEAPIQPAFRAVCLDFADTLFWRDGAARIITLADAVGITVPISVAGQLWTSIRAASVTPEELGKRRDCSAEAHRSCWTALYRPVDALAPGLDPPLSHRLYDDQRDPHGWHPYAETVAVLRALHDRGVPVAVVSDIGWDVRPVFAHYGVADCVRAWVLSFAHGTEKPDPALYRVACEVLGMPASSTLMIGDSVHKDGGAARAGLTSVVLPPWTGVGPRGLAFVTALVAAH